MSRYSISVDGVTNGRLYPTMQHATDGLYSYRDDIAAGKRVCVLDSGQDGYYRCWQARIIDYIPGIELIPVES